MQTEEFNTKALRLIKDYFSSPTQKAKFGQEYSSWKEIKYVIPQCFIIGPLSFNIDLYDLFFIMKDVNIVIFADVKIPYMAADNITNLQLRAKNVEKIAPFKRMLSPQSKH